MNYTQPEVSFILENGDPKFLPHQGSEDAVGWDVSSSRDVTIPPKTTVQVPIGLQLAGVDKNNFYLHIVDRSSLASGKGGLKVCGGTVDPDYRGFIEVILENKKDVEHNISKYDRIAQIIFPVVVRPKISAVTTITPTKRGTSGFGSTGITWRTNEEPKEIKWNMSEAKYGRSMEQHLNSLSIKPSVPQPPPINKGEEIPHLLNLWLSQNVKPRKAMINICKLIEQRKLYGIGKYGQPLMSEDGRDSLEDARQELADALQYTFKSKLHGDDVSDIRQLANILVQLCDSDGIADHPDDESEISVTENFEDNI